MKVGACRPASRNKRHSSLVQLELNKLFTGAIEIVDVIVVVLVEQLPDVNGVVVHLAARWV